MPCSAEISAASSSRCAYISSRNLNSTCARLTSEVSRQPGNAALAAATAASTSATDASATLPLTSPVAGLKISLVRPSPSTRAPLIQWLTDFTELPLR